MTSFGRLNAFLYISQFKRYAGLRGSSLAKAVPALLALVALWRRWPLPFLLFLALFLLVQILYGYAARRGYTRFVADPRLTAPPDGVPPMPAEERLPVRFTGVGALQDREEHVLLRKAEFWRVPLGDHVIMISQQPQRFLYEFIQRDVLVAVQAGRLVFGPRPLPTLAITFGSSWGPSYAHYQRAYYVGNEPPPPPSHKTVYLTFEDETARLQAWRSLLLGSRDEG